MPPDQPGAFASLEEFLAAAMSPGGSQEAERRLRGQLSRPGAHPWVQPDGGTAAFFWFDEGGALPDTRHEPEAFLSTNIHRWPGRAENIRRAAWPMVRVPGTGVLFRAEKLPRDARVHYRFLLAQKVRLAADAPGDAPSETVGDLSPEIRIGDRRALDPLNPARSFSGFGPNSVLRMPGFREPEAVAQRPASVPPKRLRERTWKSSLLGTERPILVYLPPEFDEGRRYPLLLVQDGLDYAREEQGLPRTLDLLIGRGEMEPVVAAFVPPADRVEEYRLSEQFPRALAEELLPELRRGLPLSEEPGAHACLGASYGALLSSYLCGRWSEAFGRGVFHAGAYAGPAYRNVAERALAGELRFPGRYFVGCGTFDFLYQQHLAITAAFGALGVETLRRETAEGHEWDAWVAADCVALPFVFPPGDGGSMSAKEKSRNV